MVAGRHSRNNGSWKDTVITVVSGRRKDMIGTVIHV
jgi:hypothetical protein